VVAWSVNIAESAVPVMKRILVAFLGRKKVLAIPQEEGVASLRGEFRFAFGEDSTGSVVTFQRYNNEFEDYIDLDSDEEIVNKEKLQAVVTHSDVS